MNYNSFRTGYRFRDIRLMLKYEQEQKRENGEYMYVTRKTVLGRWREIKQQMFEQEKQFEEAYNGR